jgi:bacterioferritin-associated ferredoxin
VFVCVCEQYNSKTVHQNASKPKCIVLNNNNKKKQIANHNGSDKLGLYNW